MKKVININFQGRVVPIEETAYDLLKQYIESLRQYFAGEEGRDEIINDIESRIAELFTERLNKGATCITDDDVNAVMKSMGRPEDFEAESIDTGAGSYQQGNESKQSQSSTSSSQSRTYSSTGRGRLYRNADDKILGGVCSGLANYFGIDPVFMRILFVVLIAPLFWVYILLWVIIPSQSIESNITKRLYRSNDDKVISGVCGGLAAYFNISTWVPRLIFALPLIIGLISGPFNWWWNDFDFWWGPKIITGSLSTTLFITYIILWISVPIAITASEKLEMRGERVDLNSIRDTVKGDLESFKSKAQNFGNEVKQTAQEYSKKAKEFGQTRAKTFTTDVGTRDAGHGIGHVIGVLFKAFFLFIAAIIAISLFVVFMGILFGGFAFFPLKDFFIDGFWQNLLAWLTLFLFFGIPLLALITWLVRRIMGVRSRNHYLGYMFGSLWFIGLVSAIILVGLLGRNFKTGSDIPEEIAITQPTNRMIVDVVSSDVHYYGGDWFGIDWEDWPFYGVNQDTLLVKTVGVSIVKSADENYHIVKKKYSRGNNPEVARQLAEKIEFDVTQSDSLVKLPRGFTISRNEKWRNQRVLINIAVPVGKRILLDRSIYRYDWFNVSYNRRGGFDFDDSWSGGYWVQPGKEYIMTPDGLEDTEKLDAAELKKGRYKIKAKEEKVESKEEENNNSNNESGGDYRYRNNNRQNKSDSTSDSTNSNIGYNSNGNEETRKKLAATDKITIPGAPLPGMIKML